MMKTLLSALIATIAVGLLVINPSIAQTPDGETPANESVCDVLQGGTPGLYGLCIAFCEAQDHAALTDPITEEELAALASAVPSGRILNNYNKKKLDGDPDMPCISVVEPCPCWTSDELSAALPPSSNYDFNFQNACNDNPSFISILENWENGDFVTGYQLFNIAISNTRFCGLVNNNYLGLPPNFRISNITAKQLEGCNALLAAHANIYKTDGVVWDCFAP